jgi:O-antigen ligase
MRPYQRSCSKVIFSLLILLAFFLPLSTSAASVTAMLLLGCWCLEGGFRQKIQELQTHPFCIALLLYALILLVGLCWTDSLTDGVAALRKSWKILLFPILLTTVRWEQRWWYVAAFIAGVTATMLLVFLEYSALLERIDLSAATLHFHTATVQLMYTPMLAFALYLLTHQLLWGQWQGWRRSCLVLFTALLVVNIFLASGRAGHVAFFVLLALLLFQYYRHNLLRACVCIAVLFPLIFFTAYTLSPMFQKRMTAIQQNIQVFETNPDTSVGLRLHFWQISWEIIKKSPWLGTGTGGFSHAYQEMNMALSPNVVTTDNPHNQYVLSAVQLGVPGILSLLGLFFIHIFQANRVKDGWERIRVAFPLFFMVIMCFESYLMLNGTGLLFSLFSAILFKNEPTGSKFSP